MRKVLVIMGMALLAILPAAASEQSNAMAVVHQFVDGFNQGDASMSAATCAEQVSIIDDFPPYYWSGAGACSTWAQAYDAWAKQNGVTEGTVTLKPRSVEVTAEQAYVVTWADFTWNQNGKPMKESHATFTVILHKGASGWLITAWTWSKP